MTVEKYVEIADGKVYITDQPAAADGSPNPRATAANVKKHLPRVAGQFRTEGEARARARGGSATDPEAQKAAAHERERIRAILQLDHAKGRERLAEQLALTEGMTVERAGELLAVAPVERPYSDGVLASEPDDEARDEAGRAIDAARRSGYIR